MKVKFDEQHFDKEILKVTWGIAIELQESFKDKLSSRHGINTAQLKSSIRAQPINIGVIEITMLERGKWLDSGTPPHMPPVESLEDWVKAKFGTEGSAWALAMHIKKHGTQPFPFLRNTLTFDLPKIIRKNINR